MLRIALVRLVVLALAAALAAGAGLPGLASALHGSAHVCMCASGASHRACPVCHPSLGRRLPAHDVEVDGAPCGDRRASALGAAEPALAVLRLVDLTPPSAVGRRSLPRPRAPADAPREPLTPPPRRDA